MFYRIFLLHYDCITILQIKHLTVQFYVLLLSYVKRFERADSYSVRVPTMPDKAFLKCLGNNNNNNNLPI